MGRTLKLRVALAALLGGLGFLIAGDASAQEDFPQRAIRLVVPFSAGGGDYIARSFIDRLAEHLKQPVVIENRGAGNTTVGTNAVAKAVPDGYTILLVNPQFSTNPTLQPNLAYKTPDDFAPIARIMSYAMHMSAAAKVPVNSIAELIAYAKANPGKLTYGSAGLGSSGHLAMEVFKKMTGTDLLHVPYNGAGPANNALIGGHVDLLFTGMSQVAGSIESGRVKMLGAGCSDRPPPLPNMKTICEQGVPGFESLVWWGILAPAGTPKEIVGKLNAELKQTMADPAVQKRLAVIDGDATVSTPAAFEAFIRSEMKKYGELDWGTAKAGK